MSSESIDGHAYCYHYERVRQSAYLADGLR